MTNQWLVHVVTAQLILLYLSAQYDFLSEENVSRVVVQTL